VHPALCGGPRAWLRGQVAVPSRQVRVFTEKCRFDDQQVRPVCKLIDGVAQPGVHDEGESLATTSLLGRAIVIAWMRESVVAASVTFSVTVSTMCFTCSFAVSTTFHQLLREWR
jgi:hypothetical protein